MDDLRKPVHRVVKPVIKAAHENQYLVSSSLFGHCGDRGRKGPLVQIVRRHRYEIAREIAWKCRGPLNLATFRAPPGGIETVIAAYETTAARSPLNISPGSLVDRCRVVATNIGTREVPSATADTGTSIPCTGRLEQDPQTIAMATAITAKGFTGMLTRDYFRARTGSVV